MLDEEGIEEFKEYTSLAIKIVKQVDELEHILQSDFTVNECHDYIQSTKEELFNNFKRFQEICRSSEDISKALYRFKEEKNIGEGKGIKKMIKGTEKMLEVYIENGDGGLPLSEIHRAQYEKNYLV